MCELANTRKGCTSGLALCMEGLWGMTVSIPRNSRPWLPAPARCTSRTRIHHGAGRGRVRAGQHAHLRSVDLPRHHGATWSFPCLRLLWNLPLRGIADGHFDDIVFDSHAIHLQYSLGRLGLVFILHIGQALKRQDPEPDQVRPSQDPTSCLSPEASTGQAPQHQVPFPITTILWL